MPLNSALVPLQPADAATFDFATLAQAPGAQGGGEGFWANQITTTGDKYTVGGIGVVASASGDSFAKAYLTEQWNEQARAVDIGIKRKADLYDIRAALNAKGIVRQYGDRWNVG